METHSVETIVAALNAADVRYLVVGGLAVVAHGYVRFTADLDLIVDLAPANVTQAIGALQRLGYRPRAPVAFEEFGDPKKRAQWTKDKGSASGVQATFIGLGDLLRLKQKAGRPQDLLDIQKLRALERSNG